MAQQGQTRASPDRALERNHKRELLGLAGAIALGIFALDLLSPLQGAVAVLYIIVILLVAQTCGQRVVVFTGLLCAMLALGAFVAGHWNDPFDSAYVRLAVSLVAILATTVLSLRDRSARTTLAEQARLLELSHDTVIIRDPDDKIVYWNDGAELLYGWRRDEAVGQSCDDLLQSELPWKQVERALANDGHWTGEFVRARRDGTRIVLASRWLLRRDPEGRGIGIIESSADVTEQKRADAERQRSEWRYSTIFNSAGFAIWEADWTDLRQYLLDVPPPGADLRTWFADHPEALQATLAKIAISDANAAAVELFGAPDRDALLGSTVEQRIAPGSEGDLADILASLMAGAELVEREVRYLTYQGKAVDLVLRLRLLGDNHPWSRVLVMALDVTERNEARTRIEQTQAELAHAARVSTLGQLAASIAHEVNQPLSAIITYGKSAKRWLARPQPDLAEAANCLDQIVANGSRAADVIARVRTQAKKGPAQTAPLDLPELIADSIDLVQREANAASIAIQYVGRDEVPVALGDRVQVQQVLVNLMLNAIQAMRETRGHPRAINLTAQADGESHVRISVQDNGNGIDGEPGRIFEPFFTTKRDGMGMGLSICRNIVETQGGRIFAANNEGAGATISFTLPLLVEAPAGAAEPADTSV